MKIENWVQHESVGGFCTYCGVKIETTHDGTFYVKPGMVYAGVPTTRWTPCTKRDA
mgnify:CR=1 FL=1